MNPIFIIGYMASGKTTFGRALSKRTGLQFIDLDFSIEQRFHRSIPHIFSEMGEERFRQIEAAMVREVGEFEDVIISCGGGTPCFHDNMAYMLQRGTTILLSASPERTLQRIKLRPGSRPRFIGMSDEDIKKSIAADLEKRQPFYNQAIIHFNGERLENRQQIHESIERFLSEHQDWIKRAE